MTGLEMVHCKHCGKPIGYTQKRICPECAKEYNIEKSKRFMKEKDIVRSVIYKADRDKLKEIAQKRGIAMYNILHELIEKLAEEEWVVYTSKNARKD